MYQGNNAILACGVTLRMQSSQPEYLAIIFYMKYCHRKAI